MGNFMPCNSRLPDHVPLWADAETAAARRIAAIVRIFFIPFWLSVQDKDKDYNRHGKIPTATASPQQAVIPAGESLQ
jgi:hypothetical protein